MFYTGPMLGGCETRRRQGTAPYDLLVDVGRRLLPILLRKAGRLLLHGWLTFNTHWLGRKELPMVYGPEFDSMWRAPAVEASRQGHPARRRRIIWARRPGLDPRQWPRASPG